MNQRPFGGLAKLLKESRIRAGLTQIEVARKLRFDQQFVSNWERGISTPPLRTMKKISVLYGIELYKIHEVLLQDSIDRVKTDLDKAFRKLGS